MLQEYWCYRIQILNIYKFAMHASESFVIWQAAGTIRKFKSRTYGIRSGDHLSCLKLMYLLSYRTGLRLNEVRCLKIQDVICPELLFKDGKVQFLII
jgi:hypothetical protein